MKTARQVQKFKAESRKELNKNRAAGTGHITQSSLAAANTLKKQLLDVSRVELLEDEITPDY